MFLFKIIHVFNVYIISESSNIYITHAQMNNMMKIEINCFIKIHDHSIVILFTYLNKSAHKICKKVQNTGR